MYWLPGPRFLEDILAAAEKKKTPRCECAYIFFLLDWYCDHYFKSLYHPNLFYITISVFILHQSKAFPTGIFCLHFLLLFRQSYWPFYLLLIRSASSFAACLQSAMTFSSSMFVRILSFIKTFPLPTVVVTLLPVMPKRI